MEQETTKKTKRWRLWLGAIIIFAVILLCIEKCGSGMSDALGNSNTWSEELGYDLVLKHNCQRGYSHINRVTDQWSGEVILDDVTWLVHEEEDSLAAFAQNRRRGYLNLRSRQSILLDESIVKAYVYEEGRALVASHDSLYILDQQQNIVARFAATAPRDTECYTYHKGQLPMVGDNGKLGLIDTCGRWSVAPEYDKISWALDEYWIFIREAVLTDAETGEMIPPHRMVKDSHLRTILEGNWCYLMVTHEGYITVADENHWQWHYALDGQLIDDFVCSDVHRLTYLTGEKRWVGSSEDPSRPITQQDVEETATLLCYVTNEGWKGLITQDGKVLTPPLFWSIKAISKNLYLCTYDMTSDHGILLNEKGQRISVR